MAVKGIGNICKSPGNISNMGGGSLPILNGTKGTLAISSSVEIADIGVAVRNGIGGAELGLGVYNFSKGSNNGSSKESDKNNNAANKKDYEKESSSNNKDIENKVQGNENKETAKAYTGGRTQTELDNLARDPSHAFKVEEQGLKEREIGLALEERGDLGKIVRDTQIDKGAEFIDTTTGLKWDVKSFESYPMGRNGIPITKVKKGAFSVDKGMEKIYGEFDKGNNVIIDKRLLTPEHIEQLKEAIKEAGIGDRIIWYP
ncbi:hypothetical protein [Clostridium aquiflavi]|uniref:Uncharacterized protein n=2 Tax=Clostridium TaxID=1485 RepID=A0ABU1EG73_9CLOT|nr:hypothetical protein [Clostridium sp. 5N-1]MDR5587395.1 hypothetical protein [Clostridium sp. 5N-1]